MIGTRVIDRRLVLAALVLIAGLSAGCSAAPPTYPSGAASWTLPLVAPLENGLLLVPVYFEGKGPFLMVADPDAPVTVIDPAVVAAAGLRGGNGPRFLDESDQHRALQFAVAQSVKVGDLALGRTELFVTPSKFVAMGRLVVGRLGRNVFYDSVRFLLDRDAGTLGLSLAGQPVSPDFAATASYRKLTYQRDTQGVMPVTRRLIEVLIDGKGATMHVDLGDVASQLRRGQWDSRGLVAMPTQVTVLDEINRDRIINEQTVASNVAWGGIAIGAHPFLPYGDKRWEEATLDGTVGLAFFTAYRVFVDWANQKLALAARAPVDATATVRMQRWPELVACAASGCAQATVTPGAPFATLHVTRAPASDGPLEVVLMIGQQAVSVSLPAGYNEVTWQIPPALVAPTQTAATQVVDISPFPRVCPADGPCVRAL